MRNVAAGLEDLVEGLLDHVVLARVDHLALGVVDGARAVHLLEVDRDLLRERDHWVAG